VSQTVLVPVWSSAQLSAEDHRALADAVQTSLEKTVSQFVTHWRGARSTVGGTVMPVRTFKTSGGFFCREFRVTVEGAGASREENLAACRRPNGQWLPGAP